MFLQYLSQIYLSSILLDRKFRNVMHDIMQIYENVDLFQQRKLEKISIKIGKAELDKRFLNNCKLCNIITKLLCFNQEHSCFNLLSTNKTDSTFIRKCPARWIAEVKNKLWKYFKRLNTQVKVNWYLYFEKPY